MHFMFFFMSLSISCYHIIKVDTFKVVVLFSFPSKSNGQLYNKFNILLKMVGLLNLMSNISLRQVL